MAPTLTRTWTFPAAPFPSRFCSAAAILPGEFFSGGNCKISEFLKSHVQSIDAESAQIRGGVFLKDGFRSTAGVSFPTRPSREAYPALAVFCILTVDLHSTGAALE